MELGHDRPSATEPQALANEARRYQKGDHAMKFVIVGGTGFIGSKVVLKLQAAGHEAVAASPSNGVNSVTGEGLEEAMVGAHAVLDVTNSPTFEPQGILDFFSKSTTNLLDAEKIANVGHHVLLSIVGIEKLPENGYCKGKLAQEELIEKSGVPYTIVRATQFMEYLGAIADHGSTADEIRISTANVQVIAAEDLVDVLVDALTGAAKDAIVQVAGPDRAPMSEVVARYLKAKGDGRTVTADPEALYFGSRLDRDMLVPSGVATIGKTHFDRWISDQS
jgi:uncharacterized protein YbjT (DUF2867 family)